MNYHIGYGNMHFDKLPKGDYSIEIFNVGETQHETNFTLTSYSDKKKIDIVEPVEFLSKPIKDNAAKAVKAEEKGVKGSHFEDKDKKMLTVKVEKDDKFTATVTMEFLTKGGFPWKTLVSNYDWKKNAKVNVITLKKGTKVEDQHYRLVTYCRSEYKACVYQIPDLEKFVSVEYW